MKIDDVNDPRWKDLLRRVRALETASPIGSSSVTRGALRVASAEGLVVEGSARVSGTLTVTGTETITGTLNVDGPLEVDGNTALRGTTTATGTVNIDGPLDIDGNVALKGDMTVSGGGEITVSGAAPVTLGIASNGFPGLQFPGGNLTAGSSSVAMQSGTAAIGVTSGQASIVVGSLGLGVNSSGVSALGRFNLDTAETVTGVTANCYIGADGRVRRIV